MSATKRLVVAFTGKWNVSEKVEVAEFPGVFGSVLELFNDDAENSKYSRLTRVPSEPTLGRPSKTPNTLFTASRSFSVKTSTTSDQEYPPSCAKRYFVLPNSIGSGGYATVFKAYELDRSGAPDTTKEVTLKFYQRDDGKKEAIVNALLGTPVETVTLSKTGGHLNILPYRHGETLKSYFEKYPLSRQSYSAFDFIKLLRNNLYGACIFADYLCLLHRPTVDRNFVITHADIKHQNILINLMPSLLPTTSHCDADNNATSIFKKGKEKIQLELIDFGLASILKNKHDREYGVKKGTPIFMPQEAAQLTGIGVKSDVYSASALFLNFAGASAPLKDKYAHQQGEFNKFHFCRNGAGCVHTHQLNDTCYVKLCRDGSLSWDPLSLNPLLAAFIERMEEADYNRRASSPEVLIFFNTLRLLIDTLLYSLQFDSLLEALERQQLNDPNQLDLTFLQNTASESTPLPPEKLAKLNFLIKLLSQNTLPDWETLKTFLTPEELNDISVLKARLTLLSLNLYKTNLEIDGYVKKPNGLISPYVDQLDQNGDAELTPQFGLHTFGDDESIRHFSWAINTLYDCGERSAEERFTLERLLKHLLASNLTLHDLTQAVKVLPVILPFVSQRYLSTDDMASLLVSKTTRSVIQAAYQGNKLTLSLLQALHIANLSSDQKKMKLYSLSRHNFQQLKTCVEQESPFLPAEQRLEIRELCYDMEDLALFKRSFEEDFHRSFFSSIFGSSMRRMIHNATLHSMTQVVNYIDRKPKSRSAKVFARIRLECHSNIATKSNMLPGKASF